ncbi:alpha/beta hydrolase [Streptomyces sudanensis]|uniref:alpha/beta hydrolase n=1 Tax=Streptomyces sudanensis TaxID=436397 RepID=UPI0020CDA345|nr:alpha/beta hydrolase [Streptomyces sudanensis]MCP9987098.1 alpha/beta hydrolase [Streptomyces sudanensis]
MRLRRTPRPFASAVALALVLAGGCAESGAPAGALAPHATAPAVSAVAAPPDAVALRPYYGQRLRWRACGTPGFQCATLKAPLDYARPDGARIDLAVARAKATGPGRRLGSLLVNPGGPGGSAVDYLQGYAGLAYPAPVRARYDMVALDPRGVARSEPVRCLDGPAMDAHTQVDPTPDDRRETALLTESLKRFASSCAKRSGRILPHVSTVEAARDMDLLRAALGDQRLTYVGASYGTFLGATYAELFPSRTGRLVLDGAVDPSLTADRMSLDQTAGFDTAFRAFAADCVTRSGCPLGTTSVRDATARMRAFLARLDRAPVPTGQDRPLGEALATIGVITAMYDEAAWPRLRTALTRAMGGEGSGLLALADTYHERDKGGGYSNLMSANAAVNCLDQPPAFTTPEAVAAAVPSFEKASPAFGRSLAWASLTCAYWPAKATGTPHRITAEGAPPIVVVGTTRDPATPYKWARSLAAQLSSGTLLTYDGDGHTAYGRGSDCVDTAINTYLLEGTPPPPVHALPPVLGPRKGRA